ncbi:MAG: DUF5615 family PIN-like protein [Anaerolineales bacterium]|nr:DUF5615 family PIN-like protein [Anaerolineales bacterium]
MGIALYMDHHVPRAVTVGLRLRDVDVLSAYEDGTCDWNDSALLDRASELERVLFTQDEDLIYEAVKRQREGVNFNGVIYAHQLRVSIGTCVDDLEVISKTGDSKDLLNGLFFLPL